MARFNRFGVLGSILLVSLVGALLLGQTLAASAAASQPPAPAIIGEACGAGELLPDWTICLHGIVGVEEAGGQIVPQDGAELTIRHDDKTVTGTTFVHPGQLIPTYGIDISSLEPGFLQPVTLEVTINNVLVTRQVIVFPNFETMSQEYDVVLPITALAPEISGSVIDFASGGAVSGATIIMMHEGVTETVQTSVPIGNEQPKYIIQEGDLNEVGAGVGDLVSLTAVFDDDTDTHTIEITDEPVVINFVTGWKCDGFDPLPQSGPGVGLPQSGPGVGLPDVACFWGYVRQDGQPLADVDIHITIGDKTFSDKTGLFVGEDLPRYGIGVWGGSELTESITITAVYNGKIDTQIITPNLDNQLSQRTDLTVAQPEGIANFIGGNRVQDLLWRDGYLWSATTGGVFRWETDTGDFTQFTTLEGLNSNNVRAIMVNPADQSVWSGGYGGVNRYGQNDSGIWESVDAALGVVNPNDPNIVFEADGSFWAPAASGLAHYDVSTDMWTSYSTADGLAHDSVRALVRLPDGTIWVGTGGGLSRFDPTLNQWETFTTNHGLANNIISDIVADNNEVLWLGTSSGLTRFDPALETGTTFTTGDGLLHNSITALNVDEDDNSIWVGTVYGANRYDQVLNTWGSVTEADGLVDNYIRAIDSQQNGDIVWFGTSDNGISQYSPGAPIEWTTFATYGLPSSTTTDIEEKDGVYWFVNNATVNRYTPGSDPEWTIFDGFNQGLPHPVTAVDIEIGPDGTVWVANFSRLSYYLPATDYWGVIYKGTNGLPDADPKVLEIDSDGSLWIGFHDVGAARYSPIDITQGVAGTWEYFTTADGLGSNQVRDIELHPDGSLWFSTPPNGITHYVPQTGLWEILTTANGLPQNTIIEVAIAPDGTLWFGGSGLTHYDHETNTWRRYTPNDSPLLSWNIYAIEFNSDGSLWVGTDDGASHFTPGGNPAWENWTTANGLADDNIRTIRRASDGTLWFGMTFGISWWHDPGQHSDLSVQISTVEGVFPSEMITYTVEVDNVGQRDALHTGVTFTLPTAVSYTSSTLVPESTSGPIVWDLGTLPDEDGPLTFEVVGTVDQAAVPNSQLNAQIEVTTTSPESFLSNNMAEATTAVRDPFHADARVTLIGPPQLQPGTQVDFVVYADNFGGVVAQNSVLTIDLPSDMTYVNATLAPATTSSPLRWNLGDLAPEDAPVNFELTLAVANNVGQADLTVEAEIGSDTLDSNTSNNETAVTAPTFLTDAQTLILVAPDRLVSRYGASPIMNKIYEVAQHPLVQGVVVDVTSDPAVAAAYAAWDADPGSWQKANDVATAIKVLIDSYTIPYPNLQYLQFVGGDDIIPFYRVADQNETMWHEQIYASYVPRETTVQAALAADRLLTDDFYADRTPSVPESPFWYDGHPLYLPDFASGRLVETPAEIITAVDAFLANNGGISLDTNLVGHLPHLTNDWGSVQCSVLQADGQQATCTNNAFQYANMTVQQYFDGYWSAPHANHFNTGLVTAYGLQQSLLNYDQSVMGSVGCHAGLNVAPSPTSGSYVDIDMPQAFLGKGGSYVGSTGYTFASYLGVGYSESLMHNFTNHLIEGDVQTLGDALLAAKQQYYAERSGWFDYTDEKVTIGMTLYGFPMLQLTTPDLLGSHAPPFNGLPEYGPEQQKTAVNIPVVVPHTYTNLTLTEHNVPGNGTFYAYEGQMLSQELLPIQPFFKDELPATYLGQSIRDIVVRHAGYTVEENFDPVINQSFALGAVVTEDPAEPPVSFGGWDRQWPYALGQFDGLVADTTSLNLTLGLYNADTQQELIFNNFVIEVIYSDESDTIPPTLTSQNVTTATDIVVAASDDVGIDEVVAICDDGQGQWSSVSLSYDGADWYGYCSTVARRAYVQLVDAAGNVTRTPWMAAPEVALQPSVGLDQNGHDVDLSWDHVGETTLGNPLNVIRYEIWRSDEPYFYAQDLGGAPYAEVVVSPSTPAGELILFTDEDALAVSGAHYYLVRAIGDNGLPSANSNRIGVFVVGLTPGGN